MLRFKQFSGSTPELERAVNAWLAEFEPDVDQMAQTTREDGTIVLSFLFQESFRGQERRMTSESRAMSDVATTPAVDTQDRPLEVQADPL